MKRHYWSIILRLHADDKRKKTFYRLYKHIVIVIVIVTYPVETLMSRNLNEIEKENKIK